MADRLLQVLTLIEAHSSTSGFDTSLAWDDRTLRANATREWRVPSKRAGANQSPDSAKSRAEAKLHGAAAG